MKKKNFQSLLCDQGYTPKSYDFESTIIGWSFDIDFTLFDSASPFDLNLSQVIRCWNSPEAYIHTVLVPTDGDIAGATRFLLNRWCSELRYSNPMLEIINVQSNRIQSVVRMLTITNSNAITLKFTVRKGDI